MKAITVATILGMAAYAAAECPNACSGHGTCCSRDMCTCYGGWTGNDCSEAVCPYGIAHVRTPLGDLDADGLLTTTSLVTDLAPEGLAERYGSFANDEHPDYMECSARGICDREAGECVCFPGYDGAACQRASCPDTGDGVCSGHGVCRSIRSLAQNSGSRSFDYSLWDQDATMGCDCDAGYSGPSCAERECPYGVDPLYTSDGSPIYTRFIIRLEGDEHVGGDYRLRVWDVHGEDYITDPIHAEDYEKAEDAFDHNNQCDEIVAALEGLPNGAISSGVTCSAMAEASMHGIEYHIHLSGTPGYLKTPEVYENNLIGTNAQITVYPQGSAGEFTDRYTNRLLDDNGNGDLWALAAGATNIECDVDGTANGDSLTPPVLLKLGDEHFVLDSVTDADTLVVSYAAARAHTSLPLFYSSDTVVDPSATVYVQAGSTNATVSLAVTEGDILTFANQRFTALTSGSRTTLDRAFAGDASNADVIAEAYYVITESTDSANQYTYVAQCSNRGICNTEEGLCECHAGTKGEACETQVSC